MKLVGSIIALCTLIGIVFGTYFWIDSRYALSEELKKTQQRLDYKIISDRANSLQERIWKIEDRCKGGKTDQTTAEELRSLKKQLDEENGRMRMMEKK